MTRVDISAHPSITVISYASIASTPPHCLLHGRAAVWARLVVGQNVTAAGGTRPRVYIVAPPAGPSWANEFEAAFLAVRVITLPYETGPRFPPGLAPQPEPMTAPATIRMGTMDT
jgi:hypothetical protein